MTESPVMLAKCISGRRISPLTGILLVALLVYSVSLLKRLRHQNHLANTSAHGSRHKRDILSDIQGIFESGLDEENLDEKVGLYIITPTYPRPEQLPELTRLSQTLMHLKNAIWIVAEDAHAPTHQVVELMERIKAKLPNIYLQSPMPEVFRKTKDEYHLPKGVSNRNKGLEWILKYGVDEAVVYFADDDNTYDLRLFNEIRKTKTVSMFPVGLVSGSPVSTPIVEDGKYAGFYVGWDGKRKFPLDMAGFAFSVKHYRQISRHKPVSMPYIRGYEEDGFLKQLEITRQSIEILTPDKILVWHTKTSKTVFKPFKRISKNDYLNTNLGPLSAYWCLFLGPYKCLNGTDLQSFKYKKKSEQRGPDDSVKIT